MSDGNIMIGFVAAFGFVPMAIVLFKRKRAERTILNGRTAQAVVYHTVVSRKPSHETFYYRFTAHDGKEYTGTVIGSPGLYKQNDSIDVYYVPDNPARSTVRGAWKSNVILIVMIIIAIAVQIMMYNLYQQENP